MSVCLLVIDDCREDYLDRGRESLAPLRFDDEVLVSDPDHELGFAGAIKVGWERALTTGCDYIFHWESDFILTTRLSLSVMQQILERFDSLAQVALKRQPWNEREKAAGGYVEAEPDHFVDRRSPAGAWTEHGKFFTTNPSLYPREIAERGWPQVKHSEGIFTHQLLADGYCFGLLGAKFDPPRVEHVGTVRTGNGY